MVCFKNSYLQGLNSSLEFCNILELPDTRSLSILSAIDMKNKEIK
jgi:hypothetical protein